MLAGAAAGGKCNRFRGTLISPRTFRLLTPSVLPPLLTVKSSSRLLSLDPPIDHLAVVQAPSATAASPAAVPPPLLKSWLRQHRKASSSLILPEMKSIGYTPDCGTCNYLFLTLSKIDQFGEAVEVLKGMGRAGCVPNCDSYGGLIAELSEARKVDAVAEVVREMM
ncbi:hypothetical protein SASPL_100388 [Salvia splendens]|uniref:Pentatricopeptide repeat-containing protein n=1 Tax=Salvia splendens TaxID=180675 RepID=A0A8X8YP21_SALSN|nr:hypothetical protein SASPL_100388 [Salvia splendens]